MKNKESQTYVTAWLNFERIKSMKRADKKRKNPV